MVISQINCYYTVSWTLVIYSITNVQSYNEATCSRGTRQVDCKCNKIVLSHYLAKWFLLFRMCDLIALTQRCKLLSFLHLIFAVLLANLKTDVISSSFEDMFDRMSEILGVTWPRPRDFWGKLFLRPLGFPKTKLRAEFEICCWNSFDDMLDRLPEILMITWPRPHHFCGNFFATLGFPKMKLRTKFEVSTSSWSSFEDMFDRMPKMWGVTWPRPRPFWGNLFVRPLGFAKAKRHTKFEVSSPRSFEDMFDCMPNVWGVTWPRPRSFWWNLFVRPLRFPKAKLRTKFDVCSWSSFEDIFDCMPKILGVTWPRPRLF